LCVLFVLTELKGYSGTLVIAAHWL